MEISVFNWQCLEVITVQLGVFFALSHLMPAKNCTHHL